MRRLALVLALAAPVAEAKPRLVYMDEALSQASFIGEVEIKGYAKGDLTYVVSGDKKATLQHAKYPDYYPEAPGEFLDPAAETKDFTGRWPKAGSKVLLLRDPEGHASLFAVKHGDSYRFWSPWVTGSVAWFKCKKDMKPGDDAGWDGCSVPAAQVKMTPCPSCATPP